MTTPVLIEAENEGRRMAFILPENVPVQGIPRPTDDSVSVAERKAERLAVMRFHGGRSSVNEAEAIGTLRKWLDARHVATQGEPVVAYYDPPWTPVFLRRNEVMIPVRGL